jgi:hypothetical protein
LVAVRRLRELSDPPYGWPIATSVTPALSHRIKFDLNNPVETATFTLVSVPVRSMRSVFPLAPGDGDGIPRHDEGGRFSGWRCTPDKCGNGPDHLALLDLVNPVGAGRLGVSGGGQARLDEAKSDARADQSLLHTLSKARFANIYVCQASLNAACLDQDAPPF